MICKINEHIIDSTDELENVEKKLIKITHLINAVEQIDKCVIKYGGDSKTDVDNYFERLYINEAKKYYMRVQDDLKISIKQLIRTVDRELEVFIHG